jgi:hypothetical protein
MRIDAKEAIAGYPRFSCETRFDGSAFTWTGASPVGICCKPLLACLNEEFARPPQTIHSLLLVLLASPTIGRDVDDR